MKSFQGPPGLVPLLGFLVVVTVVTAIVIAGVSLACRWDYTEAESSFEASGSEYALSRVENQLRLGRTRLGQGDVSWL